MDDNKKQTTEDTNSEEAITEEMAADAAQNTTEPKESEESDIEEINSDENPDEDSESSEDEDEEHTSDEDNAMDVGAPEIGPEEDEVDANDAGDAQAQQEKEVNKEPSEEESNSDESEYSNELKNDSKDDEEKTDDPQSAINDQSTNDDPNAKWYVVHTYSGHENKVATNLRQRIESEHLEHKILDILVPTQDKIEIRSGKKEQVKEKVFPGYILVRMVLDDIAWLAVRTTQGVISFIGMGNKPTPIPDHEVKSIVQFMSQGAAPTYKEVFLVDDTVKIIDGPFADFIGKVDSVDKEKGKLRVLVSIFGRETPVELDFLQVQKL